MRSTNSHELTRTSTDVFLNSGVEGKIQSDDGSNPKFYPTDTALLKRMFGIGGREMAAYGYIRCHNVQPTVNFRDEDRERYAEFEGEQPSVLERLNTAPKD